MMVLKLAPSSSSLFIWASDPACSSAMPHVTSMYVPSHSQASCSWQQRPCWKEGVCFNVSALHLKITATGLSIMSEFAFLPTFCFIQKFHAKVDGRLQGCGLPGLWKGMPLLAGSLVHQNSPVPVCDQHWPEVLQKLEVPF